MTVARKHSLFAVGLGATVLGGITQQSLATGSEVRGEATSGELYARFKSLYRQALAPGFTTLSLRTALGVSGVMGVSLADLSGGLALYASRHSAGGTRYGASSHRKFAFEAGILVPQRLEVSHGGDATLTYAAVCVSADGSTAPVTITDAVSLPTISAAEERFTLGEVTLGAISLPQLRQVSIDFGVSVAAEAADGDIYDTFSSIAQQDATITLRGIDLEWLKSTNIPLAGKAATHANTAIYLRRRSAGGTYYSGANHIEITAAGMATIDQAMTASGAEAGECSLVLQTLYDGTNAPIILTLDQSLPA